MRLLLKHTITNLHQVAQMPPAQIASIVGVDLAYVVAMLDEINQ